MSDENATKKDLKVALLENNQFIIQNLELRDKEILKSDLERRKEVDKALGNLMSELKSHPLHYQNFITTSIKDLTHYIDNKLAEMNNTLRTEYATKKDIESLEKDRLDRKDFNRKLLYYAVTATIGIIGTILYKVIKL